MYCARVAVLRGRLALAARRDGGAEVVHLVAGVVDVELADQVRRRTREHAGDRVAEGGPAGVADVQRAGRVRGDELEVDRLAGESVVAAVGSPCSTIVFASAPAAGGIEPDVDEAGAGDLHATRRRGSSAMPSAISAASSRGLAPSGLASFIAMFDAQSPWSRFLRALEQHVVGADRHGLGAASLERLGDDDEDRGGKFGWSHGDRFYRGGCGRPNRRLLALRSSVARPRRQDGACHWSPVTRARSVVVAAIGCGVGRRRAVRLRSERRSLRLILRRVLRRRRPRARAPPPPPSATPSAESRHPLRPPPSR